MYSRIPIGFIVEGHGEFNCYPSFYCRAVGINGVEVPRINAGGCGSLVRHIREHLTSLFATKSPLNVIITVDLQDIIKQGIANNCVELLSILNADINQWIQDAKADSRLLPLPNRITCVVQIRKFETWLLSDVVGLKNNNLVAEGLEEITDAELINDPLVWLKNNLLEVGSPKNPRYAKRIVSALEPSRMRNNSRSFDKFYRECIRSHSEWISYCDLFNQ